MRLREDLIAQPEGTKHDREAWSGVRAYKDCYCCHGTGYVVRVERLLKSFHTFTRPVLCKRFGCTAASRVQIDSAIVDTRLTAQECQELHERGLADWQTADRTWCATRQQARIKQLSATALRAL